MTTRDSGDVEADRRGTPAPAFGREVEENRFRKADRDAVPPVPRPARMERDRGDVLAAIDRDDDKQARVVWQAFRHGTLGPVVAFRLWTLVNGEPVPVPGAGLQFRAHELPALVAALTTALARARRWASREEAADAAARRLEDGGGGDA